MSENITRIEEDRRVTTHVVEGDPNSAALEIRVLDAPGAGGANHMYAVLHGDTVLMRVNFQNGPIGESGINGVTQEVLLAIVIDRLSSFQNGPFRCIENALARHHAELSLKALQQRTIDRLARGVEGKNVK